jgi:alkylated DNA repair protein (DNA oxidative demethylase)
VISITKVNIGGFDIYKDAIPRHEQHAMLEDLRKVVLQAPLFQMRTMSGKVMSVRTTAAGKYGWFSDEAGYRYVDKHPNGTKWPDIPPRILKIWHAVTDLDRIPDCCLLNFYSADARMGLHQDKDEQDFSFPVLSISLGDAGLFRVGGTSREDKTQSIWLESGDVCLMGGDARLAYHGIDRLRANSSALLPKGGRINLTLRVVDK